MLTIRTGIWITALGLAAAVPLAASAGAGPMKVLVTNDDGYNAPGIDALVNKLILNTNLDVVVVAPQNNSSGTGENRTAGAIGVYAGTTASNYPVTIVQGFPGDAALYGILEEYASDPPALVVSGINNGQNLSAEIIPISGTVGAATWAARHGIPAIAVSAGFGSPPNYADAADYTAALVEYLRTKKSFYKKLFEKEAPFRGLVLNVNFPTCTSGAVRGVVLVPVGRLSTYTGYTLTGSSMGIDQWTPSIASMSFGASNCTSTLTEPTSDIEAFNNGFATITPLDPERNVTGRKLKQFKKAVSLVY
ncbi:MAG: 5'/3'-nucleotidase SurE [bacterium]